MHCFECKLVIVGEPIWFTPWNDGGKATARGYHEPCLPSIFGNKKPLGNRVIANMPVGDGCKHSKGRPAGYGWRYARLWQPRWGGAGTVGGKRR